MARADYLSDDDGDLRIENEDFVLGGSGFQEIKRIVKAAPGEYRQYPQVGFLIDRYKNTTTDRKLQFVSELTEQLEADGFKVSSIDVSAKEWWKDFIVNADE